MTRVLCRVLRYPWDQEHQRNHAGAEHRQVPDNIHVGQGGSLPMQRVVNERVRHMKRAGIHVAFGTGQVRRL